MSKAPLGVKCLYKSTNKILRVIVFISFSLICKSKVIEEENGRLTLEYQLGSFIESMYDQGILDDNFDRIRATQSVVNPEVVSERITMVIHEADIAIAILTRLMSNTEVNFGNLINNVLRLRGHSASVGGSNLIRVCVELQLACIERNIERCLEAFECVKQEYHTLRDSLNHIRQLEQSIMAYKNRRRHP